MRELARSTGEAHDRKSCEMFHRRVTTFKSRVWGRYLLDDLLTGVRLSVLHDGVCVSKTGESTGEPNSHPPPPKRPVWPRLDCWGTSHDASGISCSPLPASLSGTHLKITASLSSQIVGSADFPFADSSARS